MAFTDKLPGEHCGWCRKALGMEADQAAPTGAKFALAAIGVFLVPLLLALIGAAALSSSGTAGGVLGGVGGFALGLLAAVGLRRWVARRPDGHDSSGATVHNDEVRR